MLLDATFLLLLGFFLIWLLGLLSFFGSLVLLFLFFWGVRTYAFLDPIDMKNFYFCNLSFFSLIFWEVCLSLFFSVLYIDCRDTEFT